MKIISVGKRHDTLFAPGIEEYSKRIRHHLVLEWKIIPPSAHSKKESDVEGAAILRAIEPSDIVVLFDEKGKLFTTEGLADIIEKTRVNSQRLVIVIGGSYGVSDAVKMRAQHTLSFGTSVFPHQLVRLMVAEQLYRGLSLLNGSKYHHE